MSLAQFRKVVVFAAEDETTTAAARKMRDARVGCVVVTREGRPVGVLTDRDIVMRIVAEGRDPSQTRVSEIVTYDPFVIEEDAALTTAAARIREHGIRRLPIVNANGQLTGIVTADELMVLLGRQLADLCGAIEDSSDASDSR